MKISFAFVITALMFSNATWAAKFERISRMKSSRIERLAAVALLLQRNERAFGDCSSTARYSFTRNASEADRNTIKQLNIAKAGVFTDEGDPTLIGNRPADQVVATLLENANSEEYEAAVNAGRATLTPAVRAVIRRNGVSVYQANHANEDGSWQIIDVFDPRNNEVLIVRFGFCGT